MAIKSIMNRSKPLVSIVIPVKNNPVGLALLLESIFRQKFSGDFEVIVVDNDSSDHTREVARQFPVRLFNQKKEGSYAARNLGIKNTRSSTIAFIDSDCLPSRTWLGEGLMALKKKDIDVVAGDIKFIFKKNKPNIYEYLDSVRKLKQKSYVKSGFSATANMFIKKNIFSNHGLFNESLLSGGDYEFGQRITKAGIKIKFSGGAVVFHPARNTFIQLVKKTIRVGYGQRKLSRNKTLNHAQINLFSFLPTITLPKNKFYGLFNIFEKIQMIMIINTVKYINLFIRIFSFK